MTRALAEYLADAWRGIAKRELLFPAVLLFFVLTVSNMVVLLDMPAPGAMPGWPFLLAAFVRIAGLFVLTVAILRIAVASERPPFRPDAAMALSVIAVAVSLAIGVGTNIALGSRTDPAGLAIANIVATLLYAPFATWVVGIVAAKPLGWRPARFMRGFGGWLPHLVFWNIVLATPMAVLHAVIDHRLAAGEIAAFWPVTIFDGALSTAMLLVVYGLQAAAYRRVAQG